jgi:magnesium transporter
MYRNATNYLQCLRQIEKISDSLEKDLLRSTKNKELVMFLSLEKSLVYFSTSLKSNETVLERILKYSYPNIHVRKYEDDEDLLEDAIIENKQAIEMTSIYSSNLSIIMDTSASIISNNLNIVMKLLAAVTIIMAIPNMISGFFGMNFADLPLATVQGAFYIIGAITLVICGIVAFILYKKGMFK